MSSTIALVLLLIAADISLWIMAIVGPLSANGRFRAYTAAAFLLALLSGLYFGWERTLGIVGIVAWIAAIVVANTKHADPSVG